MNLQIFLARFNDLKAKGFVESKRKGPTGVGHTLEAELGIAENNIALPDLSGAELKAHRVESASMITLFTFNRNAWQMPPLEAIRQFGNRDKNGRFGLYYTMSLIPNSIGLYLHIADDSVAVRHIDGAEIAKWNLDRLAERFLEKIPAMILVSAKTEERDGVEYFHYMRARLLKNTSADVLRQQFQEQNIVMDLRLHDKGTSARNHGTGFRAREDRLPFLFSEMKIIA